MITNVFIPRALIPDFEFDLIRKHVLRVCVEAWVLVKSRIAGERKDVCVCVCVCVREREREKEREQERVGLGKESLGMQVCEREGVEEN